METQITDEQNQMKEEIELLRDRLLNADEANLQLHNQLASSHEAAIASTNLR